ncbi:TIGR04255 family protein [Metabacillus idriensis]|nr:TIGR04255 family protein [Metabacillus idriensis]
MARKYYNNPPIKEVVCEFRFSQTSQWDPTIPGLIFERLREEFPNRDKGKNIETELTFDNDQVQPKVTLLERAIFRNVENNIIIQVGTNHLVINHLIPYSNWDNYLRVIDKAFTAYKEVTEATTLDRIELRHINEFSFEPGVTFNLEDYFDFYPHFGMHLENGYNSFIVGIQAQYEDDIQKMQMVSNENTIILDETYFSGKPNTINFEEVLDWLNIAHERNNNAFESAIKQKLRNSFGEVRDE